MRWRPCWWLWGRWASAPSDDDTAEPVEDEWVPFLSGDVGGYAALAVRQLGPEHTDRAFDALLDRLPTVDGDRSLTLLGAALRLAFPGGPPTAGAPVETLTPRQRRLAEALGSSTEPWLIDGQEFGNAAELLSGYGLPQSRAAVHGYLARTP
ncbi:hypothetical protein ACLQ24_27610 [Micromonospora sp. DT4]|uniref:hypothetical protein n=1 Tax=Micromonospora sp. DT4 TaxID=3393438 RepID=UPI003CED9A64